MTSLSSFRRFLNKRAHYNRTVRELRSLSPAEANDLGINVSEARSIARAAVYGS
ncbi:DUF1127 domain-containing protein [Amaricoccus macauensis]|uniref:DUF1127 domain-containing protein n=1 Tax=Amaricoccus macauensis TaxID=57001 RepID=UPI003C7C5011